MPDRRTADTTAMTTTLGERTAVPTERVVARMRSHGRVLFWPALVLWILAAANGYLWGSLAEVWQQAALAAGTVILALTCVILPAVLWLSRRYTITTRRVIARSGFFVRERREIFHSRGYQVAVKRSWFQAIFRSGSVVLTSGVDKPVVLRDVPDASLVAETLHVLIERNQTALSPVARAYQAGGGQPV